MELKNLESEISSKLETLKRNIEGSGKDSSTSFKDMFARCQKNLIWCEKQLDKLSAKVEDEYPIEYNEARDHVITRGL